MTFYAAFAAALVSVIAIGVAVRYLWYGDSAPTPTKVELVVSDESGGSTTVCGAASIDDTGSITIKPGLQGDPASTIPANLIEQIGFC
ncbi:hypothetical protein JK386_02450 [Nocardioides sp. zg-536]|uniref:Uncharacterized protein n=1 Tax=Nocardioides faecalis TaxID=2803858 RepID=A0A938Y7P5_9ACTN|nr:hypothetical protein [Nocardioides faecalis]MBM9458749.1 hypothetical protein [Nocardioides faecalis]QVI60167.1 hypothetical protein KG111_07710 [Nocardioides faecalis]